MGSQSVVYSNMAHSYNGYYTGLSNRIQEFDSPMSRQVFCLHRLRMVRTRPFQGRKSGSTPDGDAKFISM